MKTSIPYYFFLIIGFVLLSNCQHDPIVEEGPEQQTNNNNNSQNLGQLPNPSNCDSDTVYFQNDIAPILQSNCAFSGCHGNGSARRGVNLSTYADIINTVEIKVNDPTGSDLYEVLVDPNPQERMPQAPRSPLSQADIEAIRIWISQGALNNSCSSCDTSKYTFTADIKPIIDAYCKGCHSGSSPSGGILLSTYNEIQSLAVSGRLYGSISHQSAYTAMPLNQPKLPQCQIDQIKNWIDSGSPNN